VEIEPRRPMTLVSCPTTSAFLIAICSDLLIAMKHSFVATKETSIRIKFFLSLSRFIHMNPSLLEAQAGTAAEHGKLVLS